jgi:glycosyltransferase involved in cell wall biosynthesis
MSEPLISVVMNCYNGERYLREAIDSVYCQTSQVWEIVFFDNASTDASSDIARSYDGRLRYFRSTETLSLGAARNEALSQCRGKFVAFLDCDDLWYPRKLEKQIPLFNDAEVGLVFSNNILFTMDGARRLNFRTAADYAVGRCFGRLLRSYFLAIPTVIIRRDVLEDFEEWFDPALSVCEEVDLFLRVAYRWKIAMCDEPLAAYRVHDESDTWRKSEKFLDEALLIIDKFRAEYPDFSRLYRDEAQEMCDRAFWSHAIFCWRAGRIASAQRAVLKIKGTLPKAYLFLFLTFIPYRWVRPVINRFGWALPK